MNFNLVRDSTETSAAEADPVGPSAGPRILLVDDQPARLLTYEALLEGTGVQCTRAHSGNEALEKLLRNEFALIVLDVNMPDMDGFETARLIREHPRFERTPIIFVTGVHVSELDRLRGYEVGCLDYIPLPIVPEIFRSKVALLVELYLRRTQLQNLNGQLESARSALERDRNLEAARRDARTKVLLQLNDEFRLLTEPAELAYAAASVLGQTLGVSRCGYGTIDRDAETITIERDWNATGIASIAGVLHFREYGTYIEELKRGETVVCSDAVTDPRTAATAQALRSIQVQSFVNMPILEQEGTVALLYLNHSGPRAWPEEELAFIRDVAERTRVAVERRRSEQAHAANLECMGILRDLSARLVIEEDAQTVFEAVLDAAVAIARADAGTIQLLDPAGNELTLAASTGLAPELLAQFARVDTSSGSSCGVALNSARRAFVRFDDPDAPDPDGAHRIHRSFGLACAQSTPLVSRTGKVLGMFSTHWRQTHALTERDGRFLDLLARQAADVIESQEAARAAREADRRKDEFIAMLSHELRNPLVPIRNGIRLLKQAPDPEGVLAKIQPMMDRQMSHIVRLIDDLLDVSRITSGRIELNRTSVSLETILSDSVEAHREKIASNGIELRVFAEEPWRIVEVDPERVVQAVSNLLSNAAKFTPSGGRIDLSVSIVESKDSSSPELMIRVRDTGIGIAAEMVPHLFELFGSSISQPRDRSGRGGLGVGLALARRIVELHGGMLDVLSAGIGLGAEFILRIPVGHTAVPVAATHSFHASRLASTRVLIVDDNADGADSMALLLASLGLDTRTSYDGASAIELCAIFRPQFVLLDVGMPGIDGHETCRRLRSLHGRSMRIVALTGWGQEGDKQLAMEAGFDAHLTKPVDSDRLVATLLGSGEPYAS